MANKTTQTTKTNDTPLPTPEEARTAFAPAFNERHQRILQSLTHIGAAPPQVLVVEGGLSHERFAAALWYTALLNCPHAHLENQPQAPCLQCPACLQIGAEVFNDLFILDGRAGRIKIQDVRDLRVVLGEPPRGNGKRVILIAEAQSLGIEAANALLKSLEEPRPGICFLLLTPQREQLLPTLVSRGWAITLAWPHTAQNSDLPNALDTANTADWERELAAFVSTGHGWFGRTGTKGAVTPALARELVLSIQRALVSNAAKSATATNANAPGLSGTHKAINPLQTCFAPFPPAGLLHVNDLLRQTEESLGYTVNPALVLDWLATQLHLAHRRTRTQRT